MLSFSSPHQIRTNNMSDLNSNSSSTLSTALLSDVHFRSNQDSPCSTFYFEGFSTYSYINHRNTGFWKTDGRVAKLTDKKTLQDTLTLNTNFLANSRLGKSCVPIQLHPP